MKILTLNNLNFNQKENSILDDKLFSTLNGDFVEILLALLSYLSIENDCLENNQILENYQSLNNHQLLLNDYQLLNNYESLNNYQSLKDFNLENLQVFNNFKLSYLKEDSPKEQILETYHPLIKDKNSFEEEASTLNIVENILWSLFTILASTLETNSSEKNYPIENIHTKDTIEAKEINIENSFKFLKEKIVSLGPFIPKADVLGNEKILNEIFKDFVNKSALSEEAKNFLLEFTKEFIGKIQTTFKANNVSLAENFEEKSLNKFSENNTFFKNFQNQDLKRDVFASPFEAIKEDKIPMGFIKQDNERGSEVKAYFSPKEVFYENNNFQRENQESLREIFRDTLLRFKEDFQKLPLRTQEELKNFFGKLFEREVKGIFENQKIGYLKVKELSFKEVYLTQSLFNYGEVSKGPEWKNVESLQGQINPNSKNLRIEALPNFIKDFVVEISPKGERKALVQLEPPELGKMELNIKVQDKEVEIHLKVEKPETLSHFNQELSQIRQQLEELGFKLRDFQLSLGFSTSERKEYADREGRKTEREVKRGETEKIEIKNFSHELPHYHKGILYRIV